MKNMTIHQIKGRIATDPVVKEVGGGKTLLTFVMAYDTPVTTDSEGSHASFIDAEVWEKVAVFFQPYLKKGLEIIVNGYFYQNRWKNADGQNRSKFKFSVNSLSITDLKFRPVVSNKNTAA